MSFMDFYSEDFDNEGFYGEEEELDLYADTTETAINANPDMSADDAFVYCMNEKGYVDLHYMAAISGLDIDYLIDELSGKAICPDPVVFDATLNYEGCFTSVQQYVKGNIINKYETVRHINDRYGLFDETEELLRKALPDAVEPEDIHMNLGASWVPEKYVASFIRIVLDTIAPPRVEYNEYMGKWIVELTTSPNHVKNNYEYGTLRMPAIKIITHALNAKSVKVYDQVPRTDGRDGYDNVLNKQETLAAQQKLKLILDRWQDYVHGNPDIERSLQEIYMDSYGYNLCRYDGSFLRLPGLNPTVKPYKHQRDAIARVVLNHNTLLAHEVGAGKTLEYMCGVHELIRMGLGHKALIVLPNTTFDSAVNTYKELYADDRILAVYPKKHFTPAERVGTIAKMKSAEYQVIFMAYSSFDMLTLSSEYSFKKKEKQLRECKIQMNAAKQYSTKNALESEMKKIQKSIDKYMEEFNYDTRRSLLSSGGVRMIVRDMFVASDDARVIARAIFEDRCKPQNLYGWITKYYAQLMKLKSAKVCKSDIMFYMSVLVDEDDYDRLYANVSGFFYGDIKEDLTCFLALEGLDYKRYAALYVPDYTVQRYGEEVVAAEALREYGWDGFDKSIVCPDSMRIKILEALDDMKQEIFLVDKNYFDRCRSQFRKSYECKSVPQWDDAKTAEGVKDNRSECGHCIIF